MKGYVFDPSRLRGSAKQREERGYRVIGQMLREHLGDDPLEVRPERGYRRSVPSE